MAPQTFVLGLDDLAAFQRNAAQDNLLLNMAPALNSARFDTRTWSPQAQFGTNFLQAFLSTALGEIGRNQVADQTKAVAALLPALYQNPSAVARPEGIDPDAFEALRAGAQMKQLERASYSDLMRQELMNELFKAKAIEGFKAEAGAEAALKESFNRKRGELLAFEAPGSDGSSASNNPDDPRYKANADRLKLVDDLRKELNARPELKSFTEVSNRFNVLKKALTDPNAISDYEFAVGLAKIFDPTSVVRESETGSIVQGQNIPSQVLGMLNQAVSGGAKLDLPTRVSLLEAAGRAYGTQKVDVDTILNQYEGIADQRGLPKDQVLPSFGKKFDFNDQAKAALAKQFPPTEEGYRQFERAVAVLGM